MMLLCGTYRVLCPASAVVVPLNRDVGCLVSCGLTADITDIVRDWSLGRMVWMSLTWDRRHCGAKRSETQVRSISRNPNDNRQNLPLHALHLRCYNTFRFRNAKGATNGQATSDRLHPSQHARAGRGFRA